jgi:hypothetical protein
MVDKNLLGGSLRPATFGGSGEKISEYIGQLLLIAPLRDELIQVTMNGKEQESEATFSQVIKVNDDGTFVDLGESPVFWSYVRRQLKEQTSPEFPFVAGRIEKGARAFRIVPPSPDEMVACETALGLWRAAVEAGNIGEDGRVSEEPF